MSEVARRCQVSPSAVSRVVAGRARSRKIENCLCQLIGMRRNNLFGSSTQSQIVTHNREHSAA
jgi:hypothetical protein